MEAPYTFTGDQIAALLIARWYPEKTGREAGVIRDWLKVHYSEYDKLQFSVRIGEGMTPNPEHIGGIQYMTTRNTQKRIDVLAWRGARADIVECKERVTPGVLGQLQTYRQLFLEANPGQGEPGLVCIGRTSDPDTIRVLQTHGITVYLYPVE